MIEPVTIRGAELDGSIVDVCCRNGVVDAIGEDLASVGTVVEAAGGALLPGLHDHHLHLLAMAAARSSVDLGAPAVTDAASFDAALAAASPDPSGWVRGVGYHETLAGPLERGRLDRLLPGRPVRVQHATGAMWVLSSTAIEQLGLEHRDLPEVERDDDGRATGRLFGGDHLVRGPDAMLDLTAVGRRLAGFGVTGVTDLTPTDDPSHVGTLAAHVLTADFPLDVTVTGGLDLPASAGAGLARGPVKLLVADHDLPAIDDLAASIARAHRRGRSVACHCASRIGLVIALAAWEQAGARDGDRIEHGAVVPVELMAAIHAHGLLVVTQPVFVRDRGDRYLTDVPAEEHPDLWRCGTLLAGGVAVAGSSDAPYGSDDPWAAMVTATQRRTARGRSLGSSERVEPAAALGLYLGSADRPTVARTVAVGEPARLCLLDRPLAAALDRLADAAVIGTIARNGWNPA